MSLQTDHIVFLKSTRVTMRPLLKEDIPFLMKWMNDPEVTVNLNAHLPMMEADELAWFESLHKRKANDVVLVIVADDKPIGTMGIHGIDWRNRTGTTGAFIGEKEYWGKGYGSEAKMILLNYAFNTLNLRKICSSVIAFNERSQKYNLKCGYKEEGRRKAQQFRKGEYWDEILFAVFKEDWLPHWEIFAQKHGLTT